MRCFRQLVRSYTQFNKHSTFHQTAHSTTNIALVTLTPPIHHLTLSSSSLFLFLSFFRSSTSNSCNSQPFLSDSTNTIFIIFFFVIIIGTHTLDHHQPKRSSHSKFRSSRAHHTHTHFPIINLKAKHKLVVWFIHRLLFTVCAPSFSSSSFLRFFTCSFSFSGRTCRPIIVQQNLNLSSHHSRSLPIPTEQYSINSHSIINANYFFLLAFN